MRVAVIGGGAAGQLAAIKAAERGHAVTLFEQNEKLGKKLFITGKGRCNLTNACDRDGFFRHVVRNPRFLYSAYANFDSAAIVELVESAGVPTKVERGQRVFPASDKSSDVLKALERTVRKSGVDVRLNTRVSEILTNGESVSGVRVGETVEPFDAVILATGGLSYPSTGSTGDGLRFAVKLGHTVTPPVGSLIPLETEERWCAELSGLTLKNVTLTAYDGRGREVYSELGEMLFTHFGVSGPLVLSASALIAENPAGTVLSIDLKPGLSEEQLDARLLRDLSANAKKRTLAAAAFGDRARHGGYRRAGACGQLLQGAAQGAGRDAQRAEAARDRRKTDRGGDRHARRRQGVGGQSFDDGIKEGQTVVFCGRNARHGRRYGRV